MQVVETERLTLRPCSSADRDNFISLELDPDVMLYLNGGHAVRLEQADPDASFLMPRGTEEHVWTARRRTSGAFVGWFCLWPDHETTAELGYRLRRADWGQGLATEGAVALVSWGFENCSHDRVLACAMASHLSSRRVLEKAGFSHTHTGMVDWAAGIPGGEQGEAWYSLTRQDWARCRAPAT